MPADDLTGRTIGGFTILAEIGAGGMAVVYKAREEALGRIVALKVPSIELANQPTFPELIARFKREARASAGISHPNLEWSAIDEEWIPLGRSPLEDVRFPKGIYRWKAELPGFETMEVAHGKNTFGITFVKTGGPLANMTRITAATLQARLAGLHHVAKVPAPAYFIDHFEVTNKQFKEFVDGGGYENRDYWKHDFLKDGRRIAWDQAMAEFRDTAGRPGPSTST